MRTCTRMALGYPITASVLSAGTDWSVLVLGGCTPHVGSVSIARWVGGLVTVDSLVGEGHKDHIVGERFARALSLHTGKTVSVTCGIHYETPGKEGIDAILSCADDLLHDLLCAAETQL